MHEERLNPQEKLVITVYKSGIQQQRPYTDQLDPEALLQKYTICLEKRNTCMQGRSRTYGIRPHTPLPQSRAVYKTQ